MTIAAFMIVSVILVFFICVVCMSFNSARQRKQSSYPEWEAEQEKKRKEEYDRIKETAGIDLVDAAPDAEYLGAESEAIAECAKQRLRDRASDAVSRLNDNRNPQGDGSGY
jgi:hypothetical protein